MMDMLDPIRFEVEAIGFIFDGKIKKKLWNSDEIR